MSYTHVIVKMNPVGKNKSVTHIETDLEKAFVLENIITPYVESYPIFVGGARIESSKVESIRAFESSQEYAEIYRNVKSKAEIQRKNASARGVMVMPMGISKESAIRSGETIEITRELFNGAQGI